MSVRRVLVVLWLALPIVTWNMVFDRQVYTAAERFTHDNLARHDRGEPVPTINEAYRPQIRVAARDATLWAALVFAAGAVALKVGSRVLS
jgi:hypothetical protein